MEQQIKQNGVKKYYLEVLQENEKAIKIYTKKGFKIEREFSVLKAPNAPNINNGFDKVKTVDLKDFNSESTTKCECLPPSYEHSTGVLNRHNGLYQVDFTEDQQGVTAFVIYSALRGSIAQLGYCSEDDLSLVIQKLISTYPNTIAKNIDMKYTQILDLLFNLGFTELTKQFEMYKEI